jgi:hypothetical protein
MGHLRRRFEEDQTSFGGRGIDASAELFAGDVVPIERRIVAAQAQPKASFAGKRSMTCTLIAAEPREERLHVAAKRDGVRIGGKGQHQEKKTHQA